jgi:hypothetical protein
VGSEVRNNFEPILGFSLFFRYYYLNENNGLHQKNKGVAKF